MKENHTMRNDYYDDDDDNNVDTKIFYLSV